MTTRIATDDEWTEVVDEAAQFYLGIDGNEFVARDERGEYDDGQAELDGAMAVIALMKPR